MLEDVTRMLQESYEETAAVKFSLNATERRRLTLVLQWYFLISYIVAKRYPFSYLANASETSQATASLPFLLLSLR